MASEHVKIDENDDHFDVYWRGVHVGGFSSEWHDNPRAEAQGLAAKVEEVERQVREDFDRLRAAVERYAKAGDEVQAHGLGDGRNHRLLAYYNDMCEEAGL